MKHDEDNLEIDKLDVIDQKVFFWLIANVNIAVMLTWIHYIESNYRRRGILLDTTTLSSRASELCTGG